MTNQDKGHTAVGILGIALVVGFFLPWLDLGGIVTVSGWQMVKASEFGWTTRLLLLGIPLGGILMALAGFARSRSAALISAGVGVGVIGYFFFKFAWGFMKTTGIGLWVVIAAAIAAIAVGATSGSKSKT